MESILGTLYINLDRPQAPDDPERNQALEEYLKMSDIIQAQYGPDFLDRMSMLQQRMDGHCGEQEFALGFQTCARLMLEALHQPSI